jgi:hypothetical protein
LALSTQGHEQFSESLLRDKMHPLLDALRASHELYGRNATALIDELKRDGILIRAGEDSSAPLLFLHRTFHEYLAAGALAGVANGKLEADTAHFVLEAAGATPHSSGKGWRQIEALVDRKAWLPEFEQVIVLLAGQLKDPAPLVGLLADETRDDFFRHGLALSAD